jgi:hypothetical protein
MNDVTSACALNDVMEYLNAEGRRHTAAKLGDKTVTLNALQ